MKQMKKEMKCCCNDDKESSGISISKLTNGCCDEKTIELTNSNNLQKTDNRLNIDNLKSLSVNILNNDLSYNSNSAFKNFLTFHIPKSDIPIRVSSLLI